MNKTPVRGRVREEDPSLGQKPNEGDLSPSTNHRSRADYREKVSKGMIAYWANNDKRRMSHSLKMIALYKDPNIRKALSNLKKGKPINYVRRSYVIEGVRYESIKDYAQRTGISLHMASKFCKAVRKKENVVESKHK